jgi:nitrous oxide reductase
MFDKNDIQTVTKVLMSPHAFADPGFRSKLEPKGELIQVDAHKQILLETQTLQMIATISDMQYGQGALPNGSYFDRVTIELTATDVVHGLSIDGYNLSTTADPGQTARLTFIADQEGSFRFRCTVTCGNLHPFMIGKLHVGQNTLLWRASGLSILALFAVIWGLRK